MVFQPNLQEQKKDYFRLKMKLHFLKADIYFLNQCKTKKVIPNFIKIKCSVNNSRTNKVVKFSQNKWLIFELKYLYGKLSNIETEVYNIHCWLMKNLHYIEYVEFLEKCWYKIGNKCKQKKTKLNTKLKILIQKYKTTKTTENESNLDSSKFVNNMSSTNFTEKEMNLLKKRTKFYPISKRSTSQGYCS